jgi:hypothetical protein
MLHRLTLAGCIAAVALASMLSLAASTEPKLGPPTLTLSVHPDTFATSQAVSGLLVLINQGLPFNGTPGDVFALSVDPGLIVSGSLSVEATTVTNQRGRGGLSGFTANYNSASGQIVITPPASRYNWGSGETVGVMIHFTTTSKPQVANFHIVPTPATSAIQIPIPSFPVETRAR